MNFEQHYRSRRRRSIDRKGQIRVLRAEGLESRIVFDATVSGAVFLDHDGDDVRAASDDGVPGVLITLSGSTDVGDAVTRTTLTRNDGTYEFPDVVTGTYSLTQNQPESIVDGGTSSSPVAGAEAADNEITNIAVEDTDLPGNNFIESAIRADYSSIVWFFASSGSPQEMFREIVAIGEEDAGDFDLAAAIRADDGNVPDVGNEPPVASADAYSTPPNTELTVSVADGLLSNDTDADGDLLSASLGTAPTNGALTLESSGAFSYTPNDDFVGTDTFTYIASDSTSSSGPTTVTITVEQAANTPPVAVDDVVSVNEDEVLSVDATLGVLANDTDAEGTELTATLVDQAADGVVSLADDGSFTYTPNANFSGSDSFTYEVSDGEASSNTAVVNITVVPVNDRPVAQDDAYSTNEDSVLAIDAVLGLLANDSDLEDDMLTAVVTEMPSHGTLVLGPDGAFTYTPDADFAGVDSFDYVADDGTAQSDPATVMIDVIDVDDVGQIVLPAEFTDPVNVASRPVDETISFAISVVDVDDADYVYQLDLEASGIPADATMPTIDANTGQFSWTPSTTGRFEIRVIVVNGDGEANQETFLLDVVSNDGGTA